MAQKRRSIGFWLLTTTTFGFLLLVCALVIISRLAFYLQDLNGEFCTGSNNQKLASESETTIAFKTNEPCQATGYIFEKGKSYRIAAIESDDEPWFDGVFEADPEGLVDKPSFAMLVGTPFRRHITRPWFELTGKVGSDGSEYFSVQSQACYQTKRDGELHLYVNDAVFGFLADDSLFIAYKWDSGPNKGAARVVVSQVDDCRS